MASLTVTKTATFAVGADGFVGCLAGFTRTSRRTKIVDLAVHWLAVINLLLELCKHEIDQ